MEDKWFWVKDLDAFVDHVRALVFTLFGNVNEIADDGATKIFETITKEEKEEMDGCLTHEESCVIIKNLARKQINKKLNATRYCVSDKILSKIVEDLNSRMVSNILNSLVNKGMLDSAYDSDKNDFVFWVSESGTKHPE